MLKIGLRRIARNSEIQCNLVTAKLAITTMPFSSSIQHPGGSFELRFPPVQPPSEQTAFASAMLATERVQQTPT